MGRLVSLDFTRQLIGKDEVDVDQNQIIQAMLEAVSADVERECRRTFEKLTFTERFTSYDQGYPDPDPQRLHLNAPIDISTQAVVVSYDPRGEHTTTSGAVTLVLATDYQVDLTEGIVTILPKASLQDLQAIPPPTGLFYQFHQEGFEVTYQGGFVKDTGEDDFVIVPEGLQLIVASKVQRDWLDCKSLKPWTPEELAQLKPYKKKDILFA